MKNGKIYVAVLLLLILFSTPIYSSDSDNIKSDIMRELRSELVVLAEEIARPYKETTDQLVTLIIALVPAVLFVAVLASYVNHQKIKKQVTEQIKRFADSSYKKIESETRQNLEQKLCNTIEIIDGMIALEHAKRQLLFAVEDIDAPSKRHFVSMQAKAEIGHFLTEIKKYQQKLKDLKVDNPDIGNTAYNIEIAGKGYHYLGSDDRTNFLKAIEHFKKVLELNKVFDDKGIHLALGNSYAGLGEYNKAIEEYEKIITIDSAQTSKDTLWAKLSTGDAYKEMFEFEKAIEQFQQVKKSQEAEKDGIYWQAKYGEACALVDIGCYNDALEIYSQFEEAKKDGIRTYVEPIWLNASIGDCYRADGKFEDAKQHYQEALDISESNVTKEGMHEMMFKLGRLLVDQERYGEANVHFRKIKEKDLHSIHLFRIVWAHSLHKIGSDLEFTAKIVPIIDELEKTINSEHREVGKFTMFWPRYHLAMAMALVEEHQQEAINKLRELKEDFKFVSNWAKSAEYADFPALRDKDEFLEAIRGCVT